MQDAHCPVCNTVVDRAREGTAECGECYVLYHRRCWRWAGACAIYGCGWTDRPHRFEYVTLDGPDEPRAPSAVLLNMFLWTVGVAVLMIVLFARSSSVKIESIAPAAVPSSSASWDDVGDRAPEVKRLTVDRAEIDYPPGKRRDPLPVVPDSRPRTGSRNPF